jgi:Regulator of Chromosome Condensation (RCC1) repeat protein
MWSRRLVAQHCACFSTLLTAIVVGCHDLPTMPAGQPDPVQGDWMVVTTGRNFTCALTRVGAAYCWGDNFGGRLGTIASQQKLPAPAAVRGGLTFRSISAGYDHVCALTNGGTAYCWGSHDYGKLGTGADTLPSWVPITEPTPVVGGLTFRSISAGSSHTCAVTQDDRAYCWGSDLGGSLGVGGTSICTPGLHEDPIAQDWGRICFRAAPAPVTGGLAFTSISAGDDYTCGVAVDGAAYCWGDNEYGALGNLDTPLNCVDTNHSLCRRFVPTRVAGDLHLSSVSTGMFHACGVGLTGKAYCWGLAGIVDQTYSYPSVTSAPLGTGASAPGGSRVPVAVGGGLDFREVTARWLRSCGVTTASRAYCWGSNSFGDLGLGNFDDPVALPRAVLMPAADAAPAVGWEEDHACAVTTSGRIFCWGGYNFFGELGTGVVGGIGINADVTNIPRPVVAPLP